MRDKLKTFQICIGILCMCFCNVLECHSWATLECARVWGRLDSRLLICRVCFLLISYFAIVFGVRDLIV